MARSPGAARRQSPAIQIQNPKSSDPFGHSGEPLVDVDPALLAKQKFALLFDTDAALFNIADFDFVGFAERLGKPTSVLLNRLVIDENSRSSKKLVEVVFDQVLLFFPKFQS